MSSTNSLTTLLASNNHQPHNHSSLHGHPVKRLFRMLSVDRADIGYIYLYAIFSGLITLTLPLGVQAIINLITGGAMTTSWAVLVAVVTLGVILSGVFQVMQLSITETLQQRLFVRAAFDFAFRIPRFRTEALSGEYAPELVNRFFDVLNVQKGLPKILIDFSAAILQIVFGLLILAFYHPFFVFFGLGMLATLFAILRFTGPGGIETSLTESKYKYKAAFWLQDVARNQETFKLETLGNFGLHKTDKYVMGYLKSRKAHFKVLVSQFGFLVGFKTLVTAFLLILGSFLVVGQQINIGQFVASEIIIISITSSVEKLILSMETLYDVLTGMEKLGHISDMEIESESGEPFSSADTGKGLEVQANDLTLTISDGAVPLHNISLHLLPGERVRLTGTEGSGKTTLLLLLAGLYDGFEGSLTYNGIPMRNFNMGSLRTQIGEAIQGNGIFGGTLLENIAMEREVSFTVLREAAEGVGLMEWVQSLPEGFDTALLPEGRGLSAGIVRRILLARAVVDKPRLLLIDDITAGFPPAARREIISWLTQPSHGWTLLLASHDDSLQPLFDRQITLPS